MARRWRDEELDDAGLYYCLDCERWEAADHKCRNRYADAKALVELDSDDHG